MIKILFFIPSLSGGGAEKVLCSLVNHMNQAKFDIMVQTIDDCDSHKYLAEGIHYRAINHYKKRLGKKLFSYWYRLCVQLKIAYMLFVKDDYDIEVAYLETGATKIIAQSTNPKAVKLAWVHCDLSQKEGMSACVDKVKAQYCKYNKIICVSENARKGFEKLYGNQFNTEILHNVIDEEEILKKADAEQIKDTDDHVAQLLAVGRLAFEKNFAYLIETCGRLRDEGYAFHLNILGEGPEKKHLEQRIQTLHLEETVTLRGFINNPYPWMKAADIIVCSSRYEGMSTVIQEAIILGKAIVTTPCGGMKELLGDSEYGLITDASDDGLYNGLKQMLDHPQEVQNYALAAGKRGKVFKKKRIIQETETFFCTNVISNH